MSEQPDSPLNPKRRRLRDSDAAFNLGVLPTEQPEKATEKRCVLRPDMPCPATDDNPYCQCPAPEAL